MQSLFGVALEKLRADELEALSSTFRCLVVDHAQLQFASGSSSSIATAPSVDVPANVRTASGLVVYPFSSTDRHFKLGRSATLSDVVIRDARVSKQHAAIAPDGERTWLWDLSSSNGTFLGDRCLAPGEAGRAVIPLGGRFRLGDVAIVLLDAARLRRLATDRSSR